MDETRKPPVEVVRIPVVQDVWTVRGPDGKEHWVVTPSSSTTSVKEALVVYDGVLRRLADR